MSRGVGVGGLLPTTSTPQNKASAQLNDDFNPALCDVIVALLRIRTGGLPLVHGSSAVSPQQNYYATNAANIGPQGDFYLSPSWQTLVSCWLLCQMWEILERPVPFLYLKWGRVKDSLAADILGYCTGNIRFFKALEYIIVERSAALRKEQQQWLQKSLQQPGDFL